MKKIIMIRSDKSYLPQIDATINYFKEKNSDLTFYDSEECSEISQDEYDAMWVFRGKELFKKTSIPIIHEYASLSTGIFPHVKNKIKCSFSSKPELRVFLNEFVQNEMNFKDGIDSLRRDMGVDDLFFRYRECVKQYDCVYIGSISKARGIDRLLHHFKHQQDKRSLLLIGNVPDDIYHEFGRTENIVFTGNVAYTDVPKYASQAVYGINYMPDKYPFNLQTSTKLLEYLAMNLTVITTSYDWVTHFMKKHGLSFITVNASLDNLESQLNGQKLQCVDEEILSSLKWNHIIEHSGLEAAIRKLI